MISLLLGTKHQRDIKRLKPHVEKINALEPEISQLSDEQLRAKTEQFKEYIEKRRAEGIEDEQILSEIMHEAFAVVREVAKRKVNMRPFDVQLMGAVVLHEGKIAEMKTGEGKTLVATMPLYLNALLGGGKANKGIHLVTVNDYLARRDATWMGPIYLSLGLSVGVIQGDRSAYLVDLDSNGNATLVPADKKEAYMADIVYGTNSEFGFDYLRDNMAIDPSQIVQRGHYYAIVDEVDSILIDEARTPLIISGPAEQSTQVYYIANQISKKLKLGEDFEVDEKAKTAYLLEKGVEKIERELGVSNLYAPENVKLLNAIIQALRARYLFKRDVDYIVKDGQVLIVDEFTGRVLPGRRYSDGLHQALEAKEGLRIAQENQTLATITYQNYFRMYEKLAGMTGTADTEAAEFWEIYKLEVVVIPTNAPVRRIDYPDVIYKTKKEKWKAVVEEIKKWHAVGRPILVGTTSIEDSELISKMLQKEGIPHSVLNAKHHEKEAMIVAKAGQKGAVTIATNMAGRGTDIKLGPGVVKCDFCILKLDEELKRIKDKERELRKSIALSKSPEQKKALEEELEKTRQRYQETLEKAERTRQKLKEMGLSEKKCIEEMPCGLYILGTTKHESRRIDNQLRGRSGRQGDPGSSKFIISLEDDLMRLFGGERLKKWLDVLRHPDEKPIVSKRVTRSIEKAQKMVEDYHFEIRKRLLEFDDVMNKQRQVIYSVRREILFSDSIKERILRWMEDVVDNLFEQFLPENKRVIEWNTEGFIKEVKRIFAIDIEVPPIEEFYLKGRREQFQQEIIEKVKKAYEAKEIEIGPEILRRAEKGIALQIIDMRWKEHLHTLDALREGIGLRSIAQRDPLVEYKRESYELFVEMVESTKADILSYLFNLKVEPGFMVARAQEAKPAQSDVPIELANIKKKHQKPPKKKSGKKKIHR